MKDEYREIVSFSSLFFFLICWRCVRWLLVSGVVDDDSFIHSKEIENVFLVLVGSRFFCFQQLLGSWDWFVLIINQTVLHDAFIRYSPSSTIYLRRISPSISRSPKISTALLPPPSNNYSTCMNWEYSTPNNKTETNNKDRRQSKRRRSRSTTCRQ